MKLVDEKNYNIYNKVYNSLKDAHNYPNITEVGSWNNEYCGINGFHYVALGKKIEK